MKNLSKLVEDASRFFKTISNEKRVTILCKLCEGEKTVKQLHSHLNISQSALSQHLNSLRLAQLVRSKKVGINVTYALNSQEVLGVFTTLDNIYSQRSNSRGPTIHQNNPLILHEDDKDAE